MDVTRRVAEGFERVFVLTGIFIKGGLLNTSAEGASLYGGLGAWPPRKFGNLKARKCYFQHCAHQYFRLDGG